LDNISLILEMSQSQNTINDRIHSGSKTTNAPIIAPPKSKGGRRSKGAKAEQPRVSLESPLTMSKGVEKLRRVLRGYYVDERVLDRLQLGVAAFMLISEEAMREMLGDDISAHHTGILIGLRTAMQREIDQRNNGAGLFGGQEPTHRRPLRLRQRLKENLRENSICMELEEHRKKSHFSPHQLTLMSMGKTIKRIVWKKIKNYLLLFVRQHVQFNFFNSL
jgi:hypothetical protein